MAANLTAQRRAFWFRELRTEGFDALSAWNGARARVRMFDALNARQIADFIADCAEDGVECYPETAAAILEERYVLTRLSPTTN